MVMDGKDDNFEKGNSHLCWLVLICLFRKEYINQEFILYFEIPSQIFIVDLMITWHTAYIVKLNPFSNFN